MKNVGDFVKQGRNDFNLENKKHECVQNDAKVDFWERDTFFYDFR